MSREFLLPDLGEGIAEAQIIRVMINPGDRVEEDQSLMEVETDKAAVEIPSPYAGTARQVHVSEGQTVNVGQVMITFDDADGEQKSAPAAVTKASAGASLSTSAPPSAMPSKIKAPRSEGPARRTKAPAAPAVRKLARELGVNLDEVQGSGPGGRISRQDVQRHIEAADDPAAAKVPGTAADRLGAKSTGPRPGIEGADKWGPIRREPLTQIRKTIAKQMARSANTAVHVTHGDEADISELERIRRQLNEMSNNDPKLTIMTFMIRALCLALRKYPIFNSSFDEEGGQIIYKDYINMGIAVDTERGLIVPVIRNADTLSLRAVSLELQTIAERIRAKKFEIEELRGGTFTITNVGALGGIFSTPIINYPEVAIIGLGRSRETPVYRGQELTKALMLPIFLSFDHRVTDGANAARLTREVIGYLECPTKLLLD